MARGRVMRSPAVAKGVVTGKVVGYCAWAPGDKWADGITTRRKAERQVRIERSWTLAPRRSQVAALVLPRPSGRRNKGGARLGRNGNEQESRVL